MEGLVDLIFIVAAIVLVVYVIKDHRHKENKELHNKYKKIKLISGIVALIFLFIGGSYPDAHGKKETAKNKAKTELNQKKAKEASEKKAAAKSSSKKEQKKTDDAVKKAREANDKQNFNDYKKKLADIPNETKNAITKAYIDPGDGYTVVVLNDDALSGSDAQTKNVVHSAWNSMNNVISNYTPFSDNKNAQMISVQDSSGNELATTSMFGDFKYKGND